MSLIILSNDITIYYSEYIQLYNTYFDSQVYDLLMNKEIKLYKLVDSLQTIHKHSESVKNNTQQVYSFLSLLGKSKIFKILLN